MKIRDMKLNDEVETKEEAQLERVFLFNRIIQLENEVANLRARIPDTPGSPSG